MEGQDIKDDRNIFGKFREKTLCKNYYRNIKETRGHLDHGITGGLILYKKLIDNYYEVKRREQKVEDSLRISMVCIFHQGYFQIIKELQRQL